MKEYFSIELVRKYIHGDEQYKSYHLITKVFGGYQKAIQKFEYYIGIYPDQRLELDNKRNASSDLGFAPLAWIN